MSSTEEIIYIVYTINNKPRNGVYYFKIIFYSTYLDDDLDIYCSNIVLEWFLVTHNFLAVARKFALPRLVVRSADLTSLRPTKTFYFLFNLSGR